MFVTEGRHPLSYRQSERGLHMEIIFELVMLAVDFCWCRRMWKQRKAADKNAA
jgi:hypothetical protein